MEKPEDAKFSFWNSFMSEKNRDEQASEQTGQGFVDRFVGYLSEKSLEMCTENLGSETGSEEYLSEGDCDVSENYVVVARATKKPQQKSFPPPLSCLSSSLMMQSRRDNGRLVVEAVSVANKHNFVAERENGRLVLSLLEGSEDDDGENEGEQFEIEIELEDDKRNDKDDREEDSEMMMMFLTMSEAHSAPRKVVNSKMATKPAVSPNRDPMWRADGAVVTARSLPPTAPAKVKRSPAGFLNVYESYWKAKSIMPTACKSVDDRANGVLLKGEELPELWPKDYVAAMRKGCKEPSRSISPWKPRCIATT